MLSFKSLQQMQDKISVFLCHFIETLNTVPGLYVIMMQWLLHSIFQKWTGFFFLIQHYTWRIVVSHYEHPYQSLLKQALSLLEAPSAIKLHLPLSHVSSFYGIGNQSLSWQLFCSSLQWAWSVTRVRMQSFLVWLQKAQSQAPEWM